eukprot:COSAG02_NODE_2470_length_8748_cov_14.026477_7_plen_819_part_00
MLHDGLLARSDPTPAMSTKARAREFCLPHGAIGLLLILLAVTEAVLITMAHAYAASMVLVAVALGAATAVGCRCLYGSWANPNVGLESAGSIVLEMRTSEIPDANSEAYTDGISPIRVDRATNLTGQRVLSAEDTWRWGISAEGLENFLDSMQKKGHVITPTTTTEEVCHTMIKPACVPEDWEDCVEKREYYTHSYRRSEKSTPGGHESPAQCTPPPGTCSLCELMHENQKETHFVGKPTVFFSHAWKSSIQKVLQAMRSYSQNRGQSSRPVYFWFDCASIDQHASQGFDQDKWSTYFQEAIREIGSTVMLMSPWHAPVPLRRAWCLWELYCTNLVGAEFDICLDTMEDRSLRDLLISGQVRHFHMVLEGLDVAKAEAGDPKNHEMIMSAVQKSAGGFDRFNNLVKSKLRQWVVARGERLLQQEMDHDSENGLFSIDLVPTARMLAILKFDECNYAAAQKLLSEVIEVTKLHHGTGALEEIDAKLNLANFLRMIPMRWREAKYQYEAALDLLEEQFGNDRRRQFFDILNQLVGFLEELRMGSTAEGVCKICKNRKCVDPDGCMKEVSEQLEAEKARLVFAIQDWKPSGMSGSQRHSLTRLTQSDPMDILDLDDELIQARARVTSATLDAPQVQFARLELDEAQKLLDEARDRNGDTTAEALCVFNEARQRLAEQLAVSVDGSSEACLIFRELLEQDMITTQTRTHLVHQLADALANLEQYSDSLVVLDTLISDLGRVHDVHHPLIQKAVAHRRDISLRQTGVMSESRILSSLYAAAESGSFGHLRAIRSELARSSNTPTGFVVPQSLAFYAAQMASRQ